MIQNTGMGIVKEGTLGVVMGTSGVVATAMNSFGENEGRKACSFSATTRRTNGWPLAASFPARDPWSGLKILFMPRATRLLWRSTRVPEQSPVGAGGVQFLPYLTGERSPYPDPDARGVFFRDVSSDGEGRPCARGDGRRGIRPETDCQSDP